MSVFLVTRSVDDRQRTEAVFLKHGGHKRDNDS